jgi:DNA-binding response OmpR family regulator
MPRILIVEDDRDIALGLAEDLTRHGHQDRNGRRRRGGRTPRERGRLGPRHPRPHAAAKGRVRGLPGAAPGRSEDADHHADGQDPRSREGPRTGAGGRRLRHQAVQPERAAGPDPGRAPPGDGRSAGIYRFGDCEVDFDRSEVRRGGTAIAVSALEFRLLEAFVRHPGRVLSRSQLIDAAWGPETIITDRVVDTHILHLRKKIEPKPAKPRYIRSVRGMGYRFEGERS